MRKVRKDKGLGQAEFAEILGVSQQTVSHWEAGRVTPTFETFVNLSTHFAINLNWLLTGAEGVRVAEAPVPYGVDPEIAELARQLQAHPRLAQAVRGLVKIDGKLVQDAEALQRVLHVPFEIAILCIATQKQHH